MKQLILSSLLAIATLLAQAQTVLTEQKHGLLPGNPNPMIITNFQTPGMAGENVTWDFSALPQVAPFAGDVVETQNTNPPLDLQNANTCLIEDDLHAYMRTSKQNLTVLGLTAGKGSMERIYNEPVVKMQYPFTYGDQFSGQTNGVQRYSNGYSMQISMDYDVVADAYGTLILPGTTLKNALRVVSTQILHYGDSPSAYTSTVVTYRWYVNSHRFPVLSLIFERNANGELNPLKGAYNPVVEIPEITISQTKENSDIQSGTVQKINAYPNPFNSTLAVTYTLTGKANVTIALYTIQGTLAKTLLQNVEQAGFYEKTYSSELQALPTGQYILRVEANGKVLTQKLLKMN